MRRRNNQGSWWLSVLLGMPKLEGMTFLWGHRGPKPSQEAQKQDKER